MSNIDKLKEILLQHKGKANAITSKEISRKMGFPMEDTQSVSRKAIWKTAKHFGLPLISCNKGYFIAETDDEITEYKSSIQNRIDGMKKREKEPSKTIRNGKNELHP